MGSLMSKRTMAPRALAMAIAIAIPALLASSAASQASSSSEGRAPAVATGGARTVGTSVVLSGSVNPHGLETSYYFQYGATNAYGSQTSTGKLPAGTAPEKVSQAAPGIKAGDHYRLVASNAKATNRTGKDRIYTGPKPTKKRKTKPVKSLFELPKSFQPTVVGGAFVLSGTLTGADNGERQVVLQASPYPYSAVFADVGAPTVTGTTGRFSFRVAHLLTSTRFRVATVGAPTLYSYTLTQLAEVQVILNVRSSTRVKGLVRLYGTVSPTAVGARVLFQLEHTPKPKPTKSEKPEKAPKSEEHEPIPTFTTKFSTVVKRATRRLSRFSLVAQIKDTGSYRAYVEMPAGPLASGHSLTIVLHAGPVKKRKSKKTSTSG